MKLKAQRKATPKKKASRVKRSVRPVAKRQTGPRTKDRQRDFIEDLMTASAQALGLTIDPAWRDSVSFHLRLVLDHAARVDAFELPDDAEPAPVFHA
jgi:1-carboxybiuret hydrolase subunit AtzG-like